MAATETPPRARATMKTRKIRQAGVFLSICCAALVVALIHLRDMTGPYWLYPLMAVTFFSLRPGEALALNGLAVVAVWPRLRFDPDMLGALLLLNVFGLVFSIRNERQKRQMAELARHDVMTGAGNRRALMEELRKITGLHRRRRMTASLILFDIDRFNEVHDALGHNTGDRALIRLTGLIRARIRATDSFFRYGGEEFVIVTNDTGLEAATELADALRRLVAESELPRRIRLTISAGIAELRDDETPAQWLRRADLALYRAKEDGRNRVAY